MMENGGKNKKEELARLNLPGCCDQLGTDHDPAVCYSFPNKNNFCYKLEHPKSIHLNHQATHCLTKAHRGCVIYQQDDRVSQVPKDLLMTVIPKRKTSRLRIILLFIIAVAIAGVIFSLAFLNFYELSNLYSPSTPSNDVSYNVGQSSEGVETSTSSGELDLLFLFPRKTKTQPVVTYSEIADTLSPTPGPELGTPIGPNGPYRIHQAELGDNLPYLASLYGTTVETIQTINCLQEGFPIRLNQVLIIMQGENYPSSLGCLKALRIEMDTPLEDISNQYKIAEGELAKLNHLGEIKVIPAGRWLIIPTQ